MFLNVDLEIASRRSLAPLLDELAGKVVVVSERRERGTHFVALELFEQRYRTPETCIARFAALLERLSPPGRRLWAGATRRTFDIGIDAPSAHPAYADAISSKTLSRAAALGANVAVTVYPAGV